MGYIVEVGGTKFKLELMKEYVRIYSYPEIGMVVNFTARYSDLDALAEAVKVAQENRRDQSE